MSSGISRALARPATDEGFYSSYAWCVNPVLSLRDLLRRLEEELQRQDAPAAEWQREERRINLYLFACAIACTLDDHLARRPWSLESAAKRFPRVRPALMAAEAALNLPHRLRSRSTDARARAWRREWTESVDAACELLLGGQSRLSEMARRLAEAGAAVGDAALGRRMRIPEGFRCQDLTHHDVRSMVDRARASLPEKDRPLIVVGPRTAGAYFAPLAAAYLRSLGYTRVGWITVRPKQGFSGEERGAISSSVASGAAVLIIDDHQNTGGTLRLLLAALRGLGAEARNITVAIPAHPARPDWTLECGVRVCALPAEERYKARLLQSGWVGAVVGGAELVQSEETAALNRKIEAHYSDGFQARLRRVFEMRFGAGARIQRVVAKSVGWGWLGYHAWVAGTRLAGFVPRPLALRDGMLVSEWAEGESLAERGGDQSQLAEVFAAYVAQRTRSLAVDGDPALDSPGYRWCGWNDLAAALGGVYGRYVGRLKTPAIRKQLRRYAAPRPVLVDGSMKPADWVRSGDQLYKSDFEQHNFGGGELDVVDAAWDLAAATFEFRLSEQAERRLVGSYIKQSGDSRVADRLLLHKILYALTTMRAAAYWIGRAPEG